jgi:hypothetical protein
MKKIISVIILVVLFLVVFFLIYKGETPEAKALRIEKQRHDAYDYAVKCSGVTPELKYEDITWIVLPGSTIRYDAVDGSINLAGYYSPKDSAIYVPEVYESRFWILAHESMHAIGFRGHPDEPFRRCRLLYEQN